jgi:hypothetical protein
MWCSGSYEHICLRGRGFESYRGMGFARRGMRMAEHGMTTGNENGLCGEEEWEWQNT